MVIFLDSFEFEHAGAAEVGSDQVRRYLGVRAGSGAERYADGLRHYRKPCTFGFLFEDIDPGLLWYFEDGALCEILSSHALEKRRKRGRFHDFAHRYPQVRNVPKPGLTRMAPDSFFRIGSSLAPIDAARRDEA